jgi:CRISPR-associated endonuclease Csn1
MLNYLPPGTNKWVTQLIKTSKGFRDKLKSLKEMLIKYRLWKEQKFQCIYTGRIIPLTNLFDATKCQIEHTIPRSISFDSELKNLTVCDSVYNNIVKNKQFPTQCPNYIETTICSTIDGNRECTPIINRVNDLIKPKVDELKKRISDLKATAKKIPDWEVDKRNANIRLRHYLYFELQYWEQKLFTFTVKKEDWKDKFKNSQLVDTQIITKYARAYLKSLFKRVDVQKATVVHTFREEIYNLPEKTRDKHSHHAVDAAVLTLIPGSASRDKQMKEYFEWKEGKNNNYVLKLPYNDFNKIHIKDDIENSVIINHTYKDTALTPSKKYARYRGRKVYIFDEYGNKIPKILQGDSIRGQLHKESYFGAIKVNERNKDGFPIKQNGKYIVKQKDEEDIIWIVCRKEIKEVDFNKDIIIDELLKKHINQQLDNGVKQNELTDFKGKRIRHLRCRYKAGKGFLTNEKAIPIKNHVFKSKYPHKQNYLTQNEENYLYLLYEGKDKNNKSVRGYKLLNLFNIASLNLKDIKHLKNEPEFKKLQKKRGKNTLDLELKDILKVGDRVILFKKSKDEITNNNVKDKLFNIFKFNEPAPSTAYIYFQNHIESRPDDELKKLEEKDFNPEKYQARIFLTCEKLNFLLENKDFKINLDGTIEWLY